ncbi:hypothetical protein [Nocardia heshunensis]
MLAVVVAGLWIGLALLVGVVLTPHHSGRGTEPVVSSTSVATPTSAAGPSR